MPIAPPLLLALGVLLQGPRVDRPSSAAAPTPITSPLELVEAIETVLADAIARAEPSVVAIDREKSGKDGETTAVRGRNPNPPRIPEVANPLFPGIEPGGIEAISFDYGSGVVIGEGGQILTAYHVVRGAFRITVKAQGGQKFEAEILAADPRSDLAVIVPRDLPGVNPPKLIPLPLGDASKLRKGSFLVALGNPYNAAKDGKASASWGILSNVARRLDPGDSGETQLRNFPTLLQLDAKLNLGMSGGAVVNMRGELVGLTTAAANASGFDAQAGYAVPVDTLGRRVIETLREGREVEYGLLGIRADAGATNRVGVVQPGTPASEGGLVVGDEVLAVGPIRVVDFASLVTAVNAFPPGEPIRLKIARNGETIEKSVILAKFPITGEVIAVNRPAPWRGLRVDYATALANIQLGGEGLGALARGCVRVVEVAPGSSADAAGLRPGQLIVSAADRPVKTPADFAGAVAGKSGPVDLVDESGRKITLK